MADQGLWFKLWCSAATDPDLSNLDLADFGRFCKLGLLIKSQGTDGQLTVRPPARTLCAMMQADSFRELIWGFRRLPGIVIATGPIEWPHGHYRPPQCDGEILLGSWYVDGRGSNTQKAAVATLHWLRYGDSTFSVSPETTVTVTFRNWVKYQGDFSTPRVARFREMKRSKRRGEETRGDEKRREEKLESKAVGSARRSPASPPPATVESLTQELGSQEVYRGLDVRATILRCEQWCQAHRKQLTKARVVNWLNGDAKDAVTGNGQPSRASRARINDLWKDAKTGDIKL